LGHSKSFANLVFSEGHLFCTLAWGHSTAGWYVEAGEPLDPAGNAGSRIACGVII